MHDQFPDDFAYDDDDKYYNDMHEDQYYDETNEYDDYDYDYYNEVDSMYDVPKYTQHQRREKPGTNYQQHHVDLLR